MSTLLALLVLVAPRIAAQDDDVLRMVATNYAFQLPARVAAGMVRVRLVNAGTEPHYALFYRLGEGKTASDFLAWRAQRGGPPAWLTVLTGPAPVSPADSTDIAMQLEPGHYLVICGYPGTDRQQHVDKGMLRELEVEGSTTSAARVAAQHTLRLGDSSFTITPPLVAGRRTIVVENTGTRVKQALIVRLADGVTLEEEKRWFDVGFAGARPGRPAGGVLRLAPGDRYTITGDFRPGAYVVLSHAAGPWETLEIRVR
jgi:hypothetical protein